MNARILILIVLVAVASAAGTYVMVSRSAHTADAHAEGEDAHESHELEIPGLKTEPAVAGEGWDALVLTGQVTVPSERLVKISPRIDGKVVSARPKVGDAVSAGQVLAVISSVDLAEARSHYRQAIAGLTAAQKNLEQELQVARLGANSVRPVEEARAENLEAQGSLADAKSELAQAKSDLAKAESELVQCKARLERARELYADQIVSKQDLESAEAEFRMDTAAVEAARSNVTQAETRIGKARAGADIAAQYLAREERVYKGRVVDARAVQSARSAVAAARTNVIAAADRIRVLGANPSQSGETIAVVSPIAGRVVSRNTNVGEMASPSDTLFTVADLSRVWVEADVFEKDLSKVHKGQTAQIRVDAYPDRVFSGTVDSIGDVLSPGSRTAKVRCAIANPQRLLKGEMFARISLITARRGNAVLIPREAILDDAGGKIAFVRCMECPEDVKAGTNACGEWDRVSVETGSVQGGRIEVLKGIEPGTEVVTVGAYQLKTALGSRQLEAGCGDH